MSEQETREAPLASSAAAGAEESRPDDGQLFVVSNRRSGLRTNDAVKQSRATFDRSFARVLSGSVNILHDVAPPEEDARRVVTVKGDPAEVARKMAELNPDVLVEAYQPRFTQRSSSLAVRLLDAAVGPTPVPPGTGQQIALELSVGTNPAPFARIKVYLQSKSEPRKLTLSEAVADSAGKGAAQFDPKLWNPVAAQVEPAAGAWDVLVRPVTDGQKISLPPIQSTGPVGWWASLTGAVDWSKDRGAGMRIGIVDTGAGPHPYLAHVHLIGSFVNGQANRQKSSGQDVDRHGTHVAGIIGSRPPDKDDPAGIAAGCDLFMARVFPNAGRGAGQGDIAMAVEALATESNVHLINLSLGGNASVIEADAIQVALEHGTLCIAAAGNDGGAPILYPAALGNVVAISAVGVPGVIPSGALEALNQPATQDKWSRLGIYLANFSNVGPQMGATAPGDGIISTVPESNQFTEPYAAMSGTSMACPVATAALAVTLSKIDLYKSMDPGIQRAETARQILLHSLIDLGMARAYQGGGLIRQV